ncbi:protein of unknown function [Streptomyces sp. SolWspMP-sol7th]|nr:protein of unknown function [Streptomyces sp. SolWspMP-sol7th]
MGQGRSSAVAQGHPALQDHPSDPDQPQPPAPAAETDLSGPSPVRHPPAPEPDVVIPAQRTGGDSPASPPQNPRVPAQRRSPENDPSHQWDEPIPFAASNVAPAAFLPEADSPEKKPKGLPQRHAISLKSIADLADSLPYLLGYVPGNSVVLLALHGARGRLGRRTAVRIPDDPAQWPQTAERAATMLLSFAGDAPDGGAAAFLRKRRGGSLPDGVVAFLFQEPEEARPGAVPPPGAAELRERLRPLAQDIRVACGRFDVPVVEALCVSTGRSWSYVTPLEEQEPAGSALLPAGSSVLAATSVYEGMPIPLPAAVLESRLLPWCTAAARAQERVLDLVALDLLPQILSSRENLLKIRRGTIGLLDNVLTRFATAPVPRTRSKPTSRTTKRSRTRKPRGSSSVSRIGRPATRRRASSPSPTPRVACGVLSRVGVSARTRNTRQRPSRSLAGRPGHSPTRARPGWLCTSRSPSILTTCSRRSWTKPSTRGSNRTRFASSCAGGRDARRRAVPPLGRRRHATAQGPLEQSPPLRASGRPEHLRALRGRRRAVEEGRRRNGGRSVDDAARAPALGRVPPLVRTPLRVRRHGGGTPGGPAESRRAVPEARP